MSLRKKVAEAMSPDGCQCATCRVDRPVAALTATAAWLRTDDGREAVSAIVRAGTVAHVSEAVAHVLDEEADR